MLQRLVARGYLTDEPYEGATFTDGRRATAAESHHTYRTFLQGFRDALAVEQYDAEARRMAGTVSPSVTERLTATLLETSPSSGPSADEQRS